jgi:hypothetical protein
MKLSRRERKRQRQQERDTRRAMIAQANNKSARKRQHYRNSVTLSRALLAEHSQKPDHQKFNREWQEERKVGRSRLYRNIWADWRNDPGSRFGAIATRAAYERRRGR